MTKPTTRAWCLPNNSSQEITSCEAPWQNTVPIPAFATKDEYRSWLADNQTEYVVLSMVEGVTPSIRVGTTNEPYRVHGIVADFDSPNMSAEEIRCAVGRISQHFPAFAYNRTFSGGLRVIWRFETPVFYYSADVYKKFIQRAVKEMKVRAIAANLDDAIENGSIYYCAGNNWTVNERAIVPQQIVELWMMDATKSAKFDDSVEIPLEVIEAEVHKRFPDRWQGDFKEGARGVRFWDPSGNAVSAIVRKTGMVAFTGDEPFLPWEKIFGKEFVAAYRASRLGAALTEMWSDGDCYYRQLSDKKWDACPATNARRHLRVHYGLSEKPAKGESNSEVELVMHQLETRKRVVGALPFPLNPNPSVVWNGQLFLNNSDAQLCAIHPEPQEWGINFPWIASYLSTLFLDERNLQAFLSWLHVWMRSAKNGRPSRGQSLFIAGPPGTGKTLLSRQILSRMMGGYADARDYFVDGGRFNSSLFEKALWCVDDSTVLSDHNAHARFSALVKAVVANDSFQYEKKYGYSGAVPFAGRLVVTLNDDPVSLGILPNTDTSLLDKTIFLRTDSCEVDVAENESERYAIIERELPFFARWIVDMELPEWVEKDSRFGIKSWHDRAILSEARAVSPSSTILDVVEEWWYLVDLEGKEKERGEKEYTCTQLYTALEHQYRSVVGRMSPITLGRHLAQAINNGAADWVTTRVLDGKKRYVFRKK